MWGWVAVIAVLLIPLALACSVRAMANQTINDVTGGEK
jgi:hypothetical protein